MNGLIVAGEASGDLHGSALADSLTRAVPGLHLSGMGGDRMAAAGVQLLYHSSHTAVVGIFEVLSKLRRLREAYRKLTRWVANERPQFAVLIDFPDFNFRLAKFLRKQGVKTFYFISPQIWAWRSGRIHFLKNHIDLMISILPFEEEIYRRENVPVVYVGHPLVEIVKSELQKQPAFERSGKPMIGLMAGSREVEAERHLPVLLETIAEIRKKLDVEAVLIWPPWLETKQQLPVSLIVEKKNRYAAMNACDLILVASGTSTLETAILNIPMLIVYRVGSFSWQLGKWLVKVPYYGLVNWIAQRQVVPEYIQDRMDPKLLARDALALLQNDEQRKQQKAELTRIVESLGPPGAADRAAKAIAERLGSAGFSRH